MVEVLVLAVIYYGAARLGLVLSFQQTNASPVWPPSGIAVAAVLLRGYPVWPGILLGAFLANVAVFVANQASDFGSILAISSCIAVGNTLEAVAAAFLLRRGLGERPPLDRAGDVFRFVVVALLACFVSCTIGATSLCVCRVAPWALYGTIWFTWWLGDVAGVLVVTPVLLTWSELPWLRWQRRRVVEAILLLARIAHRLSKERASRSI
jgi:integral membrane sensor domain MASE1